MKIDIAVKYRANIGLYHEARFLISIFKLEFMMLQSFPIGQLTVVLATIFKIQLQSSIRYDSSVR